MKVKAKFTFPFYFKEKTIFDLFFIMFQEHLGDMKDIWRLPTEKDEA